MSAGGRRRVTVVALAVAAVAVFAGSTFANPAVLHAQSGNEGSAIQELLDRRAAAVMRRDVGEFMATVAGDSRAFVRRQRRLFAHMIDLPFSSYKLVLRWDRFGDLATPSDRARYGDADDVAIPLTEERYRLEGFDRREAIEDMFYTFVEQDGEWKIAEDTDLDDIAFYSARHMWDYAPVDVQTSRHFMLLEPGCSSCPAAPSGTFALAKEALTRVRGYWAPAWRQRVPIVIPTSADDLKRMLQVTFELDNFVAFAYSSVDRTSGIDYTGHRVLLNPDAFIGRSSSSTLQILAHELLHIASRSSSGPFVPSFVEEGIAEYVGHDSDPAGLNFFYGDVAEGNFDGLLPDDYRFVVGSGIDVFRSYQKSYSAIRYFVDRWGLGSLTRFYRRLGRVEVAAGTTEYHVDRALRRTVGIGIDNFETAWAGSIGGS